MKSFEYEATVKSFLPDIFGASVFFLYAIFSTRIPFDTFYSSLKFFISVVIFMQFGCAIITDHLCYHKISTRVKSFYTSKTTISERTHLFDELIQYPFYTALMTFFYFFIGSAAIAYYFYSYLELPLNITGLFVIEELFGSYFASIIGFTFCSKIVSKIGIDIINAGIEKEYVMHKKFFSLRFKTKLWIYVAIPAILTCFINCAVLISGYYSIEGTILPEDGSIQTLRMLSTNILNIILLFISIIFFYNDISNKNTRMTEVLNGITSTDFSKVVKYQGATIK